MSENFSMTGAEFTKKIRALARAKRLPYRLDASRGKGSHGTLYLGNRFTIIKDRKKEIGPGLLASVLSDLGLTREDIQ